MRCKKLEKLCAPRPSAIALNQCTHVYHALNDCRVSRDFQEEYMVGETIVNHRIKLQTAKLTNLIRIHKIGIFSSIENFECVPKSIVSAYWLDYWEAGKAISEHRSKHEQIS